MVKRMAMAATATVKRRSKSMALVKIVVCLSNIK